MYKWGLKPKWKWDPQKAPTSLTGCRGPEGLEATFLLPFSHRLEHFCCPQCPGVSFGHRDYRTTPHVWLFKSKCCYTAAALHVCKYKVIPAEQGSFISEEYLTWLCSSLIKAQLYPEENLCSRPFLWFWRVNHNLNTYNSLGYLQKKPKNAFQENAICGSNKLKSLFYWNWFTLI